MAVTCFASNIARIISIISAANENNRHVCVVGRALHRSITAARETGYLDNIPDFVSEVDSGLMPRENLVIICTGSQGETRAALAKISNGMHENIKLQAEDTVIFSSRQIPGNENAIARVQNQFLRQKINIITDEKYFLWSSARRGGGHSIGSADEKNTQPGTNAFISLAAKF